MKKLNTSLLSICFLMIAFSALSGCGQKGPLEIERTPTVQEEELEDTI
jgi:predicted small lipoprotein YifL